MSPGKKEKYEELLQLLLRLDPQWIHTRTTEREKKFLSGCSSCKYKYDSTKRIGRRYLFKDINFLNEEWGHTAIICEDCMRRLQLFGKDKIYSGPTQWLSLFRDDKKKLVEYYEEKNIAMLQEIINRILEEESSSLFYWATIDQEKAWKKRLMDFLNFAMEGFGDQFFPGIDYNFSFRYSSNKDIIATHCISNKSENVYTLETLKKYLSEKVPKKMLDLLKEHRDYFFFEIETVMPVFKGFMSNLDNILFLYRIRFMTKKEYSMFIQHLKEQVLKRKQTDELNIKIDIYNNLRTILPEIFIEYLSMVGFEDAPFFKKWYDKLSSASSLNHQVLSCITNVFKKHSLSNLDILMLLEEMKEILDEAGFYSLLKRITFRKLRMEIL